MQLLLKTPWGFLGLVGVILLILIYLIKQNFQQKMISSTHVWKLSLKYAKKRIPINKFRNILIFLCQMAAIVACALIMATPLLSSEAGAKSQEKIFIIDASASMLTLREGNSTRFEYAVEQVRINGLDALNKEGLVTVILAGREAVAVVSRTSSSLELNTKLAKLVEGDTSCTFGAADIAGAMAIAELVLAENALSEVILYTPTTYLAKEGVTVVDVSLSEWNAAILDFNVRYVNSYYTFEVEVVSYNKPAFLDVTLEVKDAVVLTKNEDGTIADPILDEHGNAETVNLIMTTRSESCEMGESKFFYLPNTDVMEDSRILADFSEIYVFVGLSGQMVDDDFYYDNSMYIYGNQRETLKVVYTSPNPEDFAPTALLALQKTQSRKWNFDITYIELKEEEDFVLSGYDMYIFEEEMPKEIPTDGVVILLDPDKAPANLGIIFGDEIAGEFSVRSSNELNQLLVGTLAEQMRLTKYLRVLSYGDFTPVLYAGIKVEGEEDEEDRFELNDPLLLIKNQPDSKVAVLASSVHFSDFVMLVLPGLLNNMTNYLLPSTINQYLYDVYENVAINARGRDVRISGGGISQELQVPEQLSLATVGTYTVEQTLLSGEVVYRNLYVRVPRAESNINKVEMELVVPYRSSKGLPRTVELAAYIAVAIIVFLFIEWWLFSREQI